MNSTNLQADWLLTAGYLWQLLFFTVAAKLYSWRHCLHSQRPNLGVHLLSPWLVHLPSEGKKKWATLWRHAFIRYSLLTAFYLLVPPLLAGIPWWLQGYLAILPFWLLIETIGATLLLYGRAIDQPARQICQRPWASRSVAEFWGRRWNRLLGDWLAMAIFSPLSRRPRLAVAMTFLGSGLIHEFLVAVPYHLLCGETIYGLMTCYFLLQYMAILVERRLRQWPLLARTFTWLAILAPCPLVLNQATLGVFRLTLFH